MNSEKALIKIKVDKAVRGKDWYFVGPAMGNKSHVFDMGTIFGLPTSNGMPFPMKPTSPKNIRMSPVRLCT